MSNHHVLSFSPPAMTAAGGVAGIAEVYPVEATDGIIGVSPLIRDALHRVRRVAPTDMPVLITGETGTGKELLARAIHRHSRRAARHLIAANLAAVPETLAAAELFGHEKGAFTGAERLRVGRFEAADRGTLFLDEIGEMRKDLQVMLLRVLQEGEFERLGGGTTRRVDVRLIAATNRDLSLEMRDGRFREDLFYRLNVFPVQLPALRDRREDIPALAEHFLQCAARKIGRQFCGIEPASLRRLQQYRWPGNIRQLQNVMEQSAVLCDDDQLRIPETAFTTAHENAAASPGGRDVFAENMTLEEVKKRYINHLLTSTRGNMMRTASILDVDRRSLYRMLARYQLGMPGGRRTSASSPESE